mmetsp:Transcript_14060/g.34045  ORF Transcript_14060/g.34045 Transcript_14060/m.34045 type:complete len:249 (-) Transcript_14060:59-805(-)
MTLRYYLHVLLRKEKDGQLPIGMDDALMGAHKSWQLMNAGYKIQYFDLIKARAYLRSYFRPEFLRTFDCIGAFAIKSDFFRMAVLYREGGWHSDWKQQCLEMDLLDRLSNGTTDFWGALDMGNEYSISRKCMSNGFMGAVPRHPVIADTLRMMMTNVRSADYLGHWLDFSLCTFGRAVAASRPSQNVTEWNVGRYSDPTIKVYSWKGRDIVRHKCVGCKGGQNWENGNNYADLWRHKRWYCEDAASIF